MFRFERVLTNEVSAVPHLRVDLELERGAIRIAGRIHMPSKMTAGTDTK
jgi:hypothetical protein